MHPAIRTLTCCLPLWLAAHAPAQAAFEAHALDFETSWADLAPNTFVQLSSLSPAPGGLRWGGAWYGQTAAGNNELRLGGVGSFQVDAGGRLFYLDSVDFRKLQVGGNIRFSVVAHTAAGTALAVEVKIDGAPDGAGAQQVFTRFTDAAAFGPLRSFTFGAFKGDEFASDRNLFVMDNLHYRLEATPAVPEPASVAMLALGLAMVALQRRRRPG